MDKGNKEAEILRQAAISIKKLRAYMAEEGDRRGNVGAEWCHLHDLLDTPALRAAMEPELSKVYAEKEAYYKAKAGI